MATVGGLNPSEIPIESSKSSLGICASEVLGRFKKRKLFSQDFYKGAFLTCCIPVQDPIAAEVCSQGSTCRRFFLLKQIHKTS